MHPALFAMTARWSLPRNAAAHGFALDRHLLLNLWIALGLLALGHVLLLAGLLWHRTPDSHSYGRRSRLALEYAPLAALSLLFFGLALRAERLWAQQRYTGADPAAMQVEVTGVQFAWYFRYPGPDATFGRTRAELIRPETGNALGIDPTDEHGEDDFVSSQLVLPVGREVDLTLHARDVIHGFAAPEMRLKQNAVPGQTSHLHFTPTAIGDYAILCTQLCGLGHNRMQAVLRVVPETTFVAWVAAREDAMRSRHTQSASVGRP